MRVAVTGVTSDFGTAILPTLLADPEIDSVVGLARRECRISHPKLESVRMDIRDTGIEGVFRGCDVVMHLAFVVEEIRDKSQTHDINLRGSRNVIDSAYRAGVRRVVVASSINAYGPELRPKPVDESVYPAGDPVRYYFHDKAEVEHYAQWWLQEYPGEMTIALLRPTYIIGPDFHNDGIDQLTSSVGAFPQADEAAYQFLHQRDMAEAFHRATKQDLVGAFNLGPRDWVGVRELAAMQGQRLFDVPEKPAVVSANIAFRLGLTPFSGQWVTAGETVVDSSKLTRATGWEPTLTAHEAAAVMILLQGKSLLRGPDALERHVACEAALEPASGVAGVDGSDVEHVQLPHSTGASVHAEVHTADSTDGSVVAVVEPGSHARYRTTLAAAAAAAGVNVVLLDLPGHGLSSGKRGHADADAVRLSIEAAVVFGNARFGASTVVRLGELPVATRLVDRILGARNPHADDADGLLPDRMSVDHTHLRALPRVNSAEEMVSRVQVSGSANLGNTALSKPALG